MASTETLGEFLAGVKASFAKYEELLLEAGLEDIEDLAELPADGVSSMAKEIGIPAFHFQKIVKAAKAQGDSPEEEEEASKMEPGALEESKPTPEEPVSESSASTVVADVRSTQLKKLQGFYRIYNPTKADDTENLNKILSEYQGDYQNMWAHLEQKYIMGNVQKVKRKAVLDTNPTTRADAILEGIATLYRENIRELEHKYKFPEFHSPLMDDIDFKSRPIVLLVGQYSVGKTSFIRYLLNRDFPGSRIGPEPTTDSFMAVMHHASERVIPGNAAVMDRDMPFRTLQRFGIQFLNKFSVSQLPAPILESITFVDTPGILSGEKQRMGRLYDFAKVVEQFAHRADRILLLFDAHKLDISDEFRNSIEMLKGHDDKVRCVLNKCDQVPNQHLLRVYGALMWSLGKVFRTPEVLRVFVGSFWDKDYENPHNADLFDSEAQDLISDLKSLPRHRVTRKINEFVKRTRQFNVHLLICEHLRAQFGWTGKESTQRKLLAGMGNEFKAIAEQRGLTLADFPNPNKFGQIVANHKMHEFPKMKKKYVEIIEEILHVEVPRLMSLLPGEGDRGNSTKNAANPFADNELAEAIMDPTKRWVVSSAQKKEYDNEFYSLALTNGHASGIQVKEVMLQSKLSPETLRCIWELSDITKSGQLDGEEFALCKWLIDYVGGGSPIPPSLTIQMVPPGKRHLLEFSAEN